MDPLLIAIDKYPNGTELHIVWPGGLKMKGTIDTIFETNNEFEMDDPSYEEYYACLVRVDQIEGNVKSLHEKVGDLVEISIKNSPNAIYLNNGCLVWSRE